MIRINAVFFLCLIALWTSAQNDAMKIEKEYENLKQATIYGRNKDAGKYYDIRGFKMYCEVYGSGDPLLIIHGNGGEINNFVKQIPYFSKKYKVIVADSRSHGKSKDSGDSLTYEMMADDYAELLTNMGVDSSFVIGWSDGAIIGLLLTMRHPQKVGKLIITGANLRPDTTAVSPAIHRKVVATYNMIKEKQDKNEMDKTVFKYFRLLVEQPNIPPQDLHKIKVPVLVIGGDHDVILPSHTLEIFQNTEKGYLWIIPGSGHSTPVIFSEEFNSEADSFLRAPYRSIEDRDRYY
jgi:pimeloyl-ACP methyl ester carboxylesterase